MGAFSENGLLELCWWRLRNEEYTSIGPEIASKSLAISENRSFKLQVVGLLTCRWFVKKKKKQVLQVVEYLKEVYARGCNRSGCLFVLDRTW